MLSSSADPHLHSLSVALRDFVLRARKALDEEIRSYPTPIPRCDAQFNAAYEQRSLLATLFLQVDAAVNGSDAEKLSAIAQFAALPSFGDGVAEKSLRASSGDALARAVASTQAYRGSVDLATSGR